MIDEADSFSPGLLFPLVHSVFQKAATRPDLVEFPTRPSRIPALKLGRSDLAKPVPSGSTANGTAESSTRREIVGQRVRIVPCWSIT